MKYLVAEGTFAGNYAGPDPGRPAPPQAKSLKKLPGFAGNTNVPELAEKPARGLHGPSPESYGEGKNEGAWFDELTNIFSSLAQFLGRSIARGAISG
jgi:hypothetical protein